jgi:hypothetical protein
LSVKGTRPCVEDDLGERVDELLRRRRQNRTGVAGGRILTLSGVGDFLEVRLRSGVGGADGDHERSDLLPERLLRREHDRRATRIGRVVVAADPRLAVGHEHDDLR